jgi:stress-induced morphogen
VAEFSPEDILVKDQSHLHAGHAGARDGKGHFEVQIVASAFEGVSRIQRHRMVFEALNDLMQTDIHALSVHAFAPGER